MIRVKTFSHFSHDGLEREVQKFLNDLEDGQKIISVSFWKNRDYNYKCSVTWDDSYG